MCCLLFLMKCVKVFSLVLVGWYCFLIVMNLVCMFEFCFELVGVCMLFLFVDWDIDVKFFFFFIILCVVDVC